jgi:hypothetical protein
MYRAYSFPRAAATEAPDSAGQLLADCDGFDVGGA